MSDEIDTSTEEVERHLEIERHHEAGLIPVSTRMLLRALAAERDALRQRAENAEAEIEKLRAHISRMTAAGDAMDGWTRMGHTGAERARKNWMQVSRAALRHEGDE